MNDFQVLNQWKSGGKGLSSSVDISDYIININIDRRSGTNINECKLICDGIPHPERDRQLFVRKSISNDGNVITDPMDKIQVFINGKVQFTGWVLNYKITSDSQQVELTLHDNCILLKRGLNVHPRPKVTYTDMYTSAIIIMLGGLVGVSIIIDPLVIAKTTLLHEYTIENGQNVYDAITELCQSLDAIISARKDGTIVVKPAYLEYTNGYDFNYNEIDYITSASTTISSSVLKPSILIQNNTDSEHKKAWVFTDKKMLEYLNGWDDTEIIDAPLAINKQVAANIAHERLCEMWRSASTQDIVIAEGNIDMDVDKVIQATIDENTDVYRVIGMTTVFDEGEGYLDKLTIECIYPHDIEYLGDMVDCKGIRDSIVAQCQKYMNIPFHPDMYYRQDLKEWGMKDTALITHTLIDIGFRTQGELTTSASTIKNDWCFPVSRKDIMPGDIITWRHDLNEMGFYIGNNKIIEVWGSIKRHMTPTIMKMTGYVVKIIMFPNFGEPEIWRLKELKDCV